MNKRPPLVILGATIAVLFGFIGIFSGVYGLNQPLTTADGLTAWPNMIVGLICLVAALGFWVMKRWSEYAYGAALAGHIVIQMWLAIGRSASGRVVPPLTYLFLLIVPLISLAVFLDIEYQRRQGILTAGIF